VPLGTAFSVIPACKIGDDLQGSRLLAEMNAVGLDTRFVYVSPGDSTLFSFCFLYPDGSGGNLTTSNAAASRVDPPFIQALTPEFARWSGRGIALAVPEVPLPARLKLLELGRAHAFYNVVSLTREEAASEASLPLLERCDLAALNLEEAASLVHLDPSATSPQAVIQSIVDKLQPAAPSLSVTCGRQGNWCWDGLSITHTPAFLVEPVNTAGAGDAHLAGVIVGLVLGLSLPIAHQLGALVAAMKVTSRHTINHEINRITLLEFARRQKAELPPVVWQFLEDGMFT
jgi:sugar/nucleoside kinase (ribokinase family)